MSTIGVQSNFFHKYIQWELNPTEWRDEMTTSTFDNKEYQREYQRHYREKNKAELAAKEKVKRDAIKDTAEYKQKQSDIKKAYYIRNKERVLARNYARRDSIEHHPHETRLNGIKSRAKRDGREFDLTLEFLSELEAKTPVCPILGLVLIYSGSREDFVNPTRASLDRIDNNKGYTMDNVHFISNRANKIKNDATLEELKSLVEYLKVISSGE